MIFHNKYWNIGYCLTNNFSICACVELAFTLKKLDLPNVQEAKIILFATILERQTFEYVGFSLQCPFEILPSCRISDSHD